MSDDLLTIMHRPPYRRGLPRITNTYETATALEFARSPYERHLLDGITAGVDSESTFAKNAEQGLARQH